jgi:regulator of replication initiation timing
MKETVEELKNLQEQRRKLTESYETLQLEHSRTQQELEAISSKYKHKSLILRGSFTDIKGRETMRTYQSEIFDVSRFYYCTTLAGQ